MTYKIIYGNYTAYVILRLSYIVLYSGMYLAASDTIQLKPTDVSLYRK